MRNAENQRDSAAPVRPPAHPIAHPIRLVSAPSVTSAYAAPGSPNDGAQTGTTPRRPKRKRRMQPRDIDQLRSWLSERDIAILQSISDHQFMGVAQVEVLHFAHHTPGSGSRIARRTLARLRDYRLLGTLQRRIGGVRAGSSGLIHYVDTVGDQLLRGRSGRLARRRSVEPSARFLAHRLAVADTHIALVLAHRQQQIELVTATVEPAAWRRYVGLGGARLILKSDLYAETGASDDLVNTWFIEVDLGTETIPTLLKKCREYDTYRRSGTEQKAGGGFPRVVWSVTHTDADKAERRRDALKAAIAADAALPPTLFRIIAPQQLIPFIAAGGQL